MWALLTWSSRDDDEDHNGIDDDNDGYDACACALLALVPTSSRRLQDNVLPLHYHRTMGPVRWSALQQEVASFSVRCCHGFNARNTTSYYHNTLHEDTKTTTHVSVAAHMHELESGPLHLALVSPPCPKPHVLPHTPTPRSPRTSPAAPHSTSAASWSESTSSARAAHPPRSC